MRLSHGYLSVGRDAVIRLAPRPDPLNKRGKGRGGMYTSVLRAAPAGVGVHCAGARLQPSSPHPLNPP